MMPRWAHQRESGLSLQGQLSRGDGSAGSESGDVVHAIGLDDLDVLQAMYLSDVLLARSRGLDELTTCIK